jgi:site-specific recombinase XerD
MATGNQKVQCNQMNPIPVMESQSPIYTGKTDVENFVEQFLAEREKLWQKGTLTTNGQELRLWARWCAARGEGEMTKAAEHWGDYWAFRCARTSPYIWCRIACAHRQFWAWAEARAGAALSPVRTPGLRKPARKRKQTVNERDFSEMLRPQYPATISSMATETMLALLAGTGARIGELCAMETEAVDVAHGEAYVRLKGGGIGKIFLDENAKEAVGKWVKEGRPRVATEKSPPTLLLTTKGKAWTNSEAARRFKIRSKKRGLASVRAHQLRHPFATRLLANGATLPELQKLLNLRNLASTLVYLHTTEEQAKAAHKLLKNRPEKPPKQPLTAPERDKKEPSKGAVPTADECGSGRAFSEVKSEVNNEWEEWL